MSTGGENESRPKSMRHKRVLDVAEEHPDASLEELASMVPSATADLVERVLEEHGDPAATDDQTDTEEDMGYEDTNDDGPTNSTVTANGHSTDQMINGNQDHDDEGDTATEDEDEYPALEDLPEKQRDVLTAVAAHPDATQQEIADHFDVTRATVSRWANSIEGFEWSDRQEFVDTVFDDPPAADEPFGAAEDESTGTGSTDDESTGAEPTGAESTGAGSRSEAGTDASESTDAEERVDPETLAEIETTLDRIEERIDGLEAASESASESESAFEDPELVHKVVHACMDADRISESEELRIIEELL